MVGLSIGLSGGADIGLSGGAEHWVRGPTPETNEIVTNICSCHNFFPLSSVQIIFIPACCLLCVL